MEGISECEYSPCYYRPDFKLKSLDTSAYVIYNESYTPVKALQNKDISFEQNGEFVEFNVDKFECHQMVVIE